MSVAGRTCLLWFVHAETSKVLEDDVVVIVGIMRVFVAMTLDRLHLFHGVDTLTLDRSCIRSIFKYDGHVRRLFGLTRSGLHQLEWHIGGQFTAQSAAVHLDSQRVRDHNTHGVRGALALTEQSGRGQIDILVLQMTVQSNTYNTEIST